jgi:predicted phosphodiesterase
VRTLPAFLLALFTAATSCYQLPVWRGQVVVHPLARASIATCGTGALTQVGKKSVTREPYLQSTTTTQTTVAWGSVEGRGEVLLREPNGTVVASVPAIYAGEASMRQQRLAAQHPKDGMIDADDIFVLAAKLDKLEPNHLYCYQVVDNGVALTEPAPLTTAAPPGLDGPIQFVALGDTGTGGDAQKAIAQRMTEVPFDLMLFLGDIAYEQGSATQLQERYFAIYANILRYVPAYTTIGNHERRTRKGQPYFDAFVLPDPERYYSFDWGDVHFVAIDTTHRDTQQVEWLRQDLEKTKQRWKIVFGHHPMYTNSLRGPQQWIRRAYSKIFADNKVDVVLTGHEHQYERFRVGTVNYVVSGGGGGRLTRFFGLHYSLKKATAHHFLHFAVSKDVLTMKAIGIDGREIETLELQKDAADAPPKVKVDDKPEEKQTPIAPEKETRPDEKLHDEPDDDKNEKHLPAEKHPEAPDKPTPEAVKDQSL